MKRKMTFAELRVLAQYRGLGFVPVSVESLRMKHAWLKLLQVIKRDLWTERTKAVSCALYYGILPWWMYERSRHYDCSYLHHLWINLKYAARWMTCRETEADRAFEKKANP